MTSTSLASAFEAAGLETRPRHPESVLQQDLEWADVVVVDYFLSTWAERDDVDSIARAPLDGLAVIASVRSNGLPPLRERRGSSSAGSPTAFVLASGNLDEASFGLPNYVLPNVFSRENNIEWAFRKDDLFTTPGALQLAQVAGAVRVLRDARVQGTDQEWLEKLLALGESVWEDDARRDVSRCRPPLHELGKRTGGMAIVRWLLHRILPYPCFLMNEQDLRARLRVDDLGFDSASSSLAAALEAFEYSGILSKFSGRRWWRAGIEAWLYDADNDAAEIAMSHGASRSQEWKRPVLVIDEDYRRTGQLVEVSNVVRVRPDDWPVFADDAFAEISLVLTSPTIRPLVEPVDEYLLPEA